MTDLWSARAPLYREATEHARDRTSSFVVAWCDAGDGVTVLDVATGGGHTAHALRDAGCTVVGADSAPGMRPDVICAAEDLPFADSSFGRRRLADRADHFVGLQAAMREMARVARRLVIVEDTLYASEYVEAAERLRDPTHVRAYNRGRVCARHSTMWVSTSRRSRSSRSGGRERLAGAHGLRGCRVRPRAGAPRRSHRRRRLRRCEDPSARGEALMAIIVDSDTRLVVQGLRAEKGRSMRCGTARTARTSSPA